MVLSLRLSFSDSSWVRRILCLALNSVKPVLKAIQGQPRDYELR